MCAKRNLEFVRRDPIVADVDDAAAVEQSRRRRQRAGQVGPSRVRRRRRRRLSVGCMDERARAFTKRIESLLAKGREAQCLGVVDHGDIDSNASFSFKLK